MALAFGLAGCNAKPAEQGTAPAEQSAAEQSAAEQSTAPAEQSAAEPSAAEPSAAEQSAEAPAEQGSGTVVGGWTLVEEGGSALTEEESSVFKRAAEVVGVNYQPVACLATQLVSGTNYAFLARGTTATAEPVTSYYIMKVYRNLKDEVELSDVKELDLLNLNVKENVDDATAVGGWEIKALEQGNTLVPAEANDAFAKASEGYVGVELRPIATLATQLVAGTNYLILCEGATVTAEPQENLYVATVYADLEGGAQMSSVELFDLVSYL